MSMSTSPRRPKAERLLTAGVFVRLWREWLAAAAAHDPRLLEAEQAGTGAASDGRFVLLAPNDCTVSARVAHKFESSTAQLQAHLMRGHVCTLPPGAELPADAQALARAELRTLAGGAIVVEGGSLRVVAAVSSVEWSAVYTLDEHCVVVVLSAFLV
ncbi:hypothetical protein T492DRAFT_902596 [Pavlovales sp. CCMP2436]|nr:hypothetical protein T492DRAFT_902596 [Pavlovales sp. CCMP2436]